MRSCWQPSAAEERGVGRPALTGSHRLALAKVTSGTKNQDQPSRAVTAMVARMAKISLRTRDETRYTAAARATAKMIVPTIVILTVI